MTRILVIEDETMIRENTVELLQMNDYEVREAENGEVGVQIAHEWTPDLIVCDITMPLLDGYGVLLELRSNAATAMIPFIFMTAHADHDSMRHGMRLGADDYLAKPFSATHLLEAVETRLQRYNVIAQAYDQQLDDLRENIMHMLPHELRTPLTAILGYTDLYLESDTPPSPTQVRNIMKRINGAGVRLYHLVENFQVFAQIEIVRSDPRRLEQMQAMTMPYPAKLLETWIAAKTSERQSDVHYTIADVPQIHVAQDNLKKIMEELLDNAIKFSSSGTPIYVTGTADDSEYMLRVSDHGRGMDAEEIARVGAYMQFHRRLYEQQGSGLGLVVVQGLAELHNGRLAIQSTPGQGTDIYVSLPL